MRQSLRNKDRNWICAIVVERTTGKALKSIQVAGPVADLIELRIDYLKDPDLPSLLKKRPKPFIITNRRLEEGGRFCGGEKERLRILKEAIDFGAEYVDIEVNTEKSLLQNLMANKRMTKIILSFHDFQKTPSENELKEIYHRMVQWNPDYIKIVTLALSWEDNLRMLSLIPYAIERRQGIIAFCMGQRGSMSRIFSPLMGAAWTYASLEPHKTSAPGQLTIHKMNEIWGRLK